MALDYGTVRIGVALSDPTGALATPLTTIDNDRRAAAKIEQLYREHRVDTIVVGYPLNLKGERGFSTDGVDDFIDQLEKKNLNIVRWDERFSSVTAVNLLREAGVKIRKDKGKVDRSAAAVILQDYLDSKSWR